MDPSWFSNKLFWMKSTTASAQEAAIYVQVAAAYVKAAPTYANTAAAYACSRRIRLTQPSYARLASERIN